MLVVENVPEVKKLRDDAMKIAIQLNDSYCDNDGVFSVATKSYEFGMISHMNNILSGAVE